MKYSCKLNFINKVFFGWEGDATSVFGLSIIEFLQKETNEIFSEESCRVIESLEYNKKKNINISTKNGTIFSAFITKSIVDDVEFYVFDIKDSLMHINPFKNDVTSTLFERIIKDYMKSVFSIASSFATKRNEALVALINDKLHNILIKILSILKEVSKGQWKNASYDYSFINLWDVIEELSFEFRNDENISFDTKTYFCFYACIDKKHTKEMLMKIISLFQYRNNKAHVSYIAEENYLTLKLAEFSQEEEILPEFPKEFDEKDEELMNEIMRYCSDSPSRIERRIYEGGFHEYVITFSKDAYVKICESEEKN